MQLWRTKKYDIICCTSHYFFFFITFGLQLWREAVKKKNQHFMLIQATYEKS